MKLTQGWTLQELLAPVNNIRFFDANWIEFGSKLSLAEDIYCAAKINALDVIAMKYAVSDIRRPSVARIMSWASSRHTSREEDMAYCLMGLFDVNMPLLYGEGGIKAFERLQTEIMRRTPDESLFAWRSNQPMSGMLATSPRHFVDSSDVLGNTLVSQGHSGPPPSMTSRGLELRIPAHLPESGIVFIHINCYVCGCYNPVCIMLWLQEQQAYRMDCGIMRKEGPSSIPDHPGDPLAKTRIVYVQQYPNDIHFSLARYELSQEKFDIRTSSFEPTLRAET